MPLKAIRDVQLNTHADLPIRSSWLFTLFRRYAKRYIARHFHAVRISRYGPIPELPRRPALIVVNHPSWWDPLIGLILTEMMPEWRVHFAPIEVQGLAQYRFLERLGFFGIDTGTSRGGLTFLRTCSAILAAPESMIWITAQGAFVDPRDRPVILKDGIGHLAHRLTGAIILPLAFEYPFWNDRCPEALVRFGRPIPVESGRDRTRAEWKKAIENALEATQDRLAEEARQRDPALFETVLGGTAGVGGVYDRWRWLRSMFGARPFRAEHASATAAKPVSHSPAADRCAAHETLANS
jgi:1-acyl-sn-glycerol-3-phosphate acyltransferase